MRPGIAIAALALVSVPATATAAGRPVPQPADPRATVVLVPGSGFHGVGPNKRIRLSLDADLWRSWGYRTRLVRYGEGADGLPDIADGIRTARRARPDLPVCVYGESSGGTFALVAAAGDPDIDCLVIGASPTDQETWAQSDRGGARRLAAEVWPDYFGLPAEDDVFEPFDVWRETEPRIPVFMIYATNDQAIPAQQGRIFADLVPGTRLRVLGKGRHAFIHNPVDARQLFSARRAVRRFVAAQTTRP